VVNATRNVRVRFDGSAKGLIAAAGKAGFAMERFEKQTRKSIGGISKSSRGFIGGLADGLVGLPKMISNAFSAVPSEIKLLIMAAGAAAGTIFAGAGAAAIVAGISLAFGGGVLAAGIAKAVKDPAVAAAWAPLGVQLSAALTTLGKHFVEPLARAAAAFAPVIAMIGPMADRLGAIFAPVVDKLSPALALAAERILPSIEKIAIASAPLFETLAAKAPIIADSIAKFFDMIARNGPAANQFFGRILDGTVRLIDFLTIVIDKLIRVYSWFERIARQFEGGWLSNNGNLVFGKIPGRAKGGSVLAGRSYMVGEEGREIFTPRQSGTIIPADKTAAALSGGGREPVEVHVFVHDGAVRDLVHVEIRESNRSLKRAALAGAGAR